MDKHLLKSSAGPMLFWLLCISYLGDFCAGFALPEETLTAVSTDLGGCDDQSLALRQLRYKQLLPLSKASAVPRPSHEPQCWFNYSRDQEPLLTLVTNLAGFTTELTSCVSFNRRLYAEAHGYEYCEFIANISQNESFNLQKWMSVNSLFLTPLPTGNFRQVVMWIDADALITNQSISALHLTNSHPGIDLLMTKDCDVECEGKTNAGVFIARNTAWTRNLTEAIFSSAHATHSSSDGTAIENWWAANPDDWNEHAVVMDMASMDSIDSNWQPGDFILHMSGNTPSNLKFTFFEKLCQVYSTAGAIATKLLLDTAVDTAIAFSR